MLTLSKIALAAAIVLGAASASAAKDNGPPNIDIQKTCRESSNVLIRPAGNDNEDFVACMNDEQPARDQLVKHCATYPALAKAKRVKPKEFLPGYVEPQASLDITQDV